jgi:AcrR family transcriptional regulator
MASVARLRREERKQETHAELVSAAARVFAQRGFHGASVDQIAAEAGFTTGALYWHFKNKEELYLAVYETYVRERIAELAEISERQGDLVTRAREAADQWMRKARSNPEFLALSLEFIVHAWRNPEMAEAFATRDAAVPLALARRLRKEAKAAEIALPLPAEELALALRELGAGLAFLTLSDPDAVRDGLYGDVVSLFLELLINEARKRKLGHAS